MLGSKAGQRRYQDIEKELPPRLRKEPRPGDNPLKRPYPPHRRDIEILDYLLTGIPKDIPTEFVDRDKRTATRPQGMLYFHVLDIQGVKLSKKGILQFQYSRNSSISKFCWKVQEGGCIHALFTSSFIQ